MPAYYAHHRRTFAVPTQDHRRCILGFQNEIRRYSDEGTAMVRRWYGGGGEEWEGEAPTTPESSQHRLLFAKSLINSILRNILALFPRVLYAKRAYRIAALHGAS